jgi:hypothetical protein
LGDSVGDGDLALLNDPMLHRYAHSITVHATTREAEAVANAGRFRHQAGETWVCMKEARTFVLPSRSRPTDQRQAAGSITDAMRVSHSQCSVLGQTKRKS